MKNILINCLSSRSGGAVSYIKNAISRILSLASTDSALSLSVLCDSNQASLIEGENKRVVIVDTQNLNGIRRVWWEKRNLPKFTLQHKIDTVFTPYQISTFRCSARSVLMLRNMEPFFFDQYKYPFGAYLRNILLKRQTIQSAKRADKVIAVSDFAEDYLVNEIGIDPCRVERIYHGRDRFFSPDPEPTFQLELNQFGIKTPFIFTCGSLLPYRRCEDVIQAFSGLAKARKGGLSLVIAGDSGNRQYKRKLKECAERSGLASRIIFIGHVSKTDILTMYRKAEIVVLASEIEACPNIALEAMSTGAAIIASDSRPLPEILGKNNAVFFEKRNVEQLQKQIDRILNSSKEISQLKSCSLERAKYFSWDTCAEQTLELLTKV